MELKIKDNQQKKFDPNAPETEEDGLIAGKLRIMKIHQNLKAHEKSRELNSQEILKKITND
jgi:hypothetical protein